VKGDSQMDSFLTQIQVEELEMDEFVYYDINTEEYITESDLFEEYEKYLDEGNYGVTFSQFINNCLTINGGTLERVGC
jgi:hypothetical protein